MTNKQLILRALGFTRGRLPSYIAAASREHSSEVRREWAKYIGRLPNQARTLGTSSQTLSVALPQARRAHSFGAAQWGVAHYLQWINVLKSRGAEIFHL